MGYLPIEIRSPRGHIVVGGGGSNNDYDDDHDTRYLWPIWLYILISVFLLMTSLFFWSLVFYCVRENRRKRQGHPFRLGGVIWSALKIALFLWIPIGIYKCCCGGGNRRRQNGNAGSYARIGEYQGGGGGGGAGAGGAVNSAWYGSSTPAPAAVAQAPYGAGGTGYAAPAGKLEPMTYAGATGAGVHQHHNPVNGPAPAATTAYYAPDTPGPPPPPYTMPAAPQAGYPTATASSYPPPKQTPTPAPTPPAQVTYTPPPPHPPAASSYAQAPVPSPAQQFAYYPPPASSYAHAPAPAPVPPWTQGAYMQATYVPSHSADPYCGPGSV